MSGASDIEWTDATWNPTRGCRKISPGCKNCYAETFAERFRGVDGHPYEDGFDPRMVPDQLGLPLNWKKPRRIFVDSMSDLFMDEVPDEYVAAVWGVMMFARRHTFQVLTKRAERLPAWFAKMGADPALLFDCMQEQGVKEVTFGFGPFGCTTTPKSDGKLMRGIPWPIPNVHVGVSVEDRKYGLPRIEHLRDVPAALRFLSVEPLLEDLGALDLRGIGWVIVGGESGPGARECDVAAVRSVVRQCRAQQVPVFVKQLGRRPVEPLGAAAYGLELQDEARARGVPLAPDGRDNFKQAGVWHRRLRLLTEDERPDRKGKTLARWPEDLQVREFPAGVARG